MKYLVSQEEFEILLGKIPSEKPLPETTVILFSAKWCGPCGRINKEELSEVLPNFLVCDIDMNDYTAGYCGIRKIPTFLVVHKTKVLETFTLFRTEEIVKKVNDLVSNLYNH